jgi:hypothetical protein
METRVAVAVVAMKTMATTAMTGAQTRTINNQLKSSNGHGNKNDDGDSNDDNGDNDGDGGGGDSGPCRSGKSGGRGEDMAKRQA